MTSRSIRAVVFDLDGTLVDSLGDIAGAMNGVLRGLGCPTHPPEGYKAFIGDGLEKLVELALPLDRRDAATRARATSAMVVEYDRRALKTTRPFSGVPKLLDELTGRRLPLAVLTNKPHEPAVALVEAALGRWRFEVILGAGPHVPRKPDPTGALRVAEGLGVAADRCLYVGDMPVDLATGRAAGMAPVAALWGFSTETALREAGGAEGRICAHPLDLLALIDATLVGNQVSPKR